VKRLEWIVGSLLACAVGAWFVWGGKPASVRDDAGSPYRWCDLAEQVAAKGDHDKAAQYFHRAAELAPNSPPILMRAANYYSSRDDAAGLLWAGIPVLRVTPAYDGILFLYFDRLKIDPEDVVKGIGNDRRALPAYLQHLVSAGRMDQAAAVWPRIVKLSLPAAEAGPLSARYVDGWLAVDPERAFREWSVLGGYPDKNRVFNGNFQNEFSGAALDWRVPVRKGVAVSRDSGSLHAVFNGEENIAGAIASEKVVLPPGQWVLQASMKTSEISTDKGLGLRVTGPKGILAETAVLRGTNDWTPLGIVFRVPELSVYSLELFRNSSLKFDSKIRGTARLTKVSLTPAPGS